METGTHCSAARAAATAKLPRTERRERRISALLFSDRYLFVGVQGERDGEENGHSKDRQRAKRPERAGEEREAEPGQESGAHRREAAQVRGGVVPPAGGLTGVEDGDQDRAAEELAEQEPQQQEPKGACDRVNRDGKAIFVDLPFRLGDDPLSNEILREPFLIENMVYEVCDENYRDDHSMPYIRPSQKVEDIFH